MGFIAQLFIILCAGIYTVFVLKLLIKRKINERNTISWLTGVFIVLILASIPHLLDELASFIGIDYPPALLFLLSSLVLLYISLKQAVQLSVLDAKVRELAQKMAVQEHKEY